MNWCCLVSTFPTKRKEEIHHQLGYHHHHHHHRATSFSLFLSSSFIILFPIWKERCSIRIQNPHANPHTTHTNGICKEIDIGTRERSIQKNVKTFSSFFSMGFFLLLLRISRGISRFFRFLYFRMSNQMISAVTFYRRNKQLKDKRISFGCVSLRVCGEKKKKKWVEGGDRWGFYASIYIGGSRPFFSFSHFSLFFVFLHLGTWRKWLWL